MRIELLKLINRIGFLLLILSSIHLGLSQEVLIKPIEIVIKTKNTNGNTINIQACSREETPRWDSNFYLTENFSIVNLTIIGDNLSCEYGFGFGNKYGENTLAYSIYTISIKNPGNPRGLVFTA